MGITLKDIARHANVSQATVSKVINNKAEGQISAEIVERVKSVIGELKYSPQRTDQKLQSWMTAQNEEVLRKITILKPTPGFSEKPGSGIGTRQLNGIMKEIEAHGAMLEIIPVSRKNDSHTFEWKWLKKFQAGDCILSTPWYIVPLLELQRRGCRIAIMQGEEFWRDLYSRYTREWAVFTYRNRQGFAAITEYLIEQGYSRIAVAVSKEYMDEPDYLPLSGYEQAMSRRHQSYRHAVVLSLNGDHRPAMAQAYEKNPFDALIYNPAWSKNWNYNLSLQANLMLPEQVRIINPYSGMPSILFQPNLTEMHYPIEEMAADAVKALLADNFEPGERFYDGRLIEHI